MFHVPNQYRIRTHPLLSTTDKDGNNGAFLIRKTNGRELWIIASDGTDWESTIGNGIKWEHVSVHVYDGKRTLTPRWEEMCEIKDLFWDGEDVVIQFHPRKSEYINNHPNTLHLWRPIDVEVLTPPSITVGIRENDVDRTNSKQPKRT